MADRTTVEKLISDFMLKTCRRRLKHLTLNQLFRLYSSLMPSMFPGCDGNGEDMHYITAITGSAAEFYIDPPLTCVGDQDLMGYDNNELAIPVGHQPPTTLPAEFHSRVKVYEIVNSPLSGYVYLVLSSTIEESRDGKFVQVLSHDRNYVSSSHLDVELVRKDTDGRHGPAVSFDIPSRLQQYGILTDMVPCKRCLVWPPQAVEWPTRLRDNGWPDSATVDRVVSNACDVVQVAHPVCREDEWTNKHQWRLSFSRAEIVLINGWTLVQQIVYHVLRAYVKIQRLTDSASKSETPVISNYHIKTLMLWACELKPKTWWNGDQNIIRICVELLHTLARWIAEGSVRHYFIDCCKLLNHIQSASESESLVIKLASVTRSEMSDWFVNRYMPQCAAFYFIAVPGGSFSDLKYADLERIVLAIVYCKETALGNQHSLNCWRQFSHVVCSIPKYCLPLGPFNLNTSKRCLTINDDIAAVDSRLCHFFTAYVFLRVVYLAHLNGLDLAVKYVDELAMLIQLNKDESLRFSDSHGISSLSLSQAAKLMKVVANNSRSTVQLIEIELSKAYLHRALSCKDTGNDSIYCLANVYLAVLYCTTLTTGQYQTAIDHCTLVTRSQDHSQCSSHVVQGELLPKIDDSLDSVLGLAVFYQYVQTAALGHRQQEHHVSVFTTELFAHYLEIRCLSNVRSSGQFSHSFPNVEIQRHRNVADRALFITDVLLARFLQQISCMPTSGRCHQPTDERSEKITTHGPNASELVELLQQYAVEHLTTFRQIEARDFGLVGTIVTTDFEALYAYRRHEYRLCFRLCSEMTRLTAGVSCSRLAKIWIYPEFVQLFDDDFASVVGLSAILDPSRSEEQSLGVLISMFVKTTGPSSVGRRAGMCVNQLTLSLYLMTQCQLKLRHSMMSVAETLHCVHTARRMSAYTDDQLTLKLAERQAIKYIRQI